MRRLYLGLAVVLALSLSAELAAQNPPPGLPSPRVTNIFPYGAKAGAPIEITITGFDLDEPSGLLFSHAGIKGVYVPPKDPPPDPKKKAKPKKLPPIPPTGPFKFQVTVDSKVPVGSYDVRVVNKWGVSNPRVFVVGEFPEVNEKEPNNDVPEAQKIAIGSTVNGVLQSPADVDYTQFVGKKSQRVIISCLASSIDSRAQPMIEVYSLAGRKLAINRNYRDNDALADLVLPEDGEYLVRLFQFTYQSGSPDHGYRLTISAAPWIDAVFPPAIEPGKPTPVTLYGRNLPGGQPSGYFIDGRPLEKAVVTVSPPADPLASQKLTLHNRIEPQCALQDGFEFSIKGPGGSSNLVPIFFTREKLVLKKGTSNSKPEAAEALAIPCEVAGMLNKKGRDWYSFEAKKGDVLYIEATSERNGLDLDFYFNIYSPPDPKMPMAKIRDVGGGVIDDENDQQNLTLHPTDFYTRTSDPPARRFVVPADGKYLVAVGCRESGTFFGPQSTYRLRIGPPKPDFRVIAKPYSKSYRTGSSGRQASTEAYEVFVHRMDDFNGAVAIAADGLPAGVKAKPIVIGPGTKWGVLVLEIAANAAPFTGAIALKATAVQADGKALSREVRPATVVWGVPPGQNVPVLARLAQSLVLAVRPEKGFFQLSANVAAATIKPPKGKDAKVSGPLVVKQGDKITLPVKAAWLGADTPNITVAAEPMMQNAQQSPLTVKLAAQPTKAKPEIAATIDVKPTALPGDYAVVFRGEAQVPFLRDPKSKGKKANTPARVFADPVLVTVIPTSVVKATVGTLPGNAIKAGSTAELTIKLDRQFDYAGEFKVKFVPAKGVIGITAKEAAAPGNKSEVKLVFDAAANAKPGAVAGLVIVTAIYNKKYTITHEAKINFNIAPADKKKKKK